MDIFDQLRRDEGLRLHPYQDTVGKTTIGYGRNLTDKGISEREADFLLANDVKDFSELLDSHLPWFQAIDSVRQGAIVNMAFNMGFKHLEEFPAMLGAVAQGDWEKAAMEMLDSKWRQEVGARAVRLAQQMHTGIWV